MPYSLLHKSPYYHLPSGDGQPPIRFMGDRQSKKKKEPGLVKPGLINKIGIYIVYF